MDQQGNTLKPLEGRLARPERQLPSGANKVQRVAQHTQGLVEDLKSWVDLKITLTQMDLRDKMQARANDAALAAVMAVLGLMMLVFVCVAAALGLGTLLGHDAWGFLAVALLLGVLAWGLQKTRPQLVRLDDDALDKDSEVDHEG